MDMNLALNTSRRNLATAQNGDCTMLRFRDFVNPGNNDKDLGFGQRLDTIVKAEARGTVYLDLVNVQYVYAADIGKVVRAWKRLNDACRRLVLCNVEPFVCELFHITRVDTLMEIRGGGPQFCDDVVEPMTEPLRVWRSF